MIDPRLKSLQLVAWNGTVTAAAATLNYTPSAVSAQLKSLAAEVGVDLLERKGRKVYPTSAGRLLLEFADELAARWEQMHSELLQTADGPPGTLRLCGFSTAAANLLPRVATDVIAAHPGAQVRIIEADPEKCFELLLADGADLAIVVTTDRLPRLDDPHFEQRPLASDPLDLLLPVGHRCAGMTSVAVRHGARRLDHGPPRAAQPPVGDDVMLGRWLQSNHRARNRGVGHRRSISARWIRSLPYPATRSAAGWIQHREGAPSRRPQSVATDPDRHPRW